MRGFVIFVGLLLMLGGGAVAGAQYAHLVNFDLSTIKVLDQVPGARDFLNTPMALYAGGGAAGFGFLLILIAAFTGGRKHKDVAVVKPPSMAPEAKRPVKPKLATVTPAEAEAPQPVAPLVTPEPPKPRPAPKPAAANAEPAPAPRPRPAAQPAAEAASRPAAPRQAAPQPQATQQPAPQPAPRPAPQPGQQAAAPRPAAPQPAAPQPAAPRPAPAQPAAARPAPQAAAAPQPQPAAPRPAAPRPAPQPAAPQQTAATPQAAAPPPPLAKPQASAQPPAAGPAAATGAPPPDPRVLNRKRIQDLVTINDALKAYQAKTGAFPKADRLAGANERGAAWIPGLSPDFMKELPRDPQHAAATQYVYVSDGANYKLLAQGVSLVGSMNVEVLGIKIDNTRNPTQQSAAFGFWTPGFAGV